MYIHKDGVTYNLTNPFIINVFLEAGFKEVDEPTDKPVEPTSKRASAKSKDVQDNGQTAKA